MFVSSQWKTVLLCNNGSHWLGANLESALDCTKTHEKEEALHPNIGLRATMH